jgi:aminoglycoside 2''-phosphotransferase
MKKQLTAFSTDEVRKIISSNFPSFVIEDICFFAEGWDNFVYRVNKRYIFRFPKSSYNEHQLKTEILLLKKLSSQVGVPVPVFQFIGKESSVEFSTKDESKLKRRMQLLKKVFRRGISIDDFSRLRAALFNKVFVGYEEIQGSALKKAVLSQLSSEQQDEVARVISKFLLSLHSFSVDDARSMGIGERHNKEHYELLFNEVQSAIFPRLIPEHCNVISELFDSYIGNLENHIYQPALLHGDLSSNHVLFDKSMDKTTGIIDFGEACIGDPDYDLTHLAWDYGEDFLKVMLKYYPAKDPNRLLKKLKFFQCFHRLDVMCYGVRTKDQELFNQGWTLLRKTLPALN